VYPRSRNKLGATWHGLCLGLGQGATWLNLNAMWPRFKLNLNAMWSKSKLNLNVTWHGLGLSLSAMGHM
jgi:hypothetical protein